MCNNTDATRDYHAQSERRAWYDVACMRNLKDDPKEPTNRKTPGNREQAGGKGSGGGRAGSSGSADANWCGCVDKQQAPAL